MSGLAKVLHQKGLQVGGSDIKESANTQNLINQGIEVKIGHEPKNIDKADAVVISSAIKPQNPELKEAKSKKINIYQRAQMLALLAKDKRVIAVSGTHGKTTTTSMVSLIFEKSGTDPTFLIGGELNDIGSNAKYGKSSYFIAETDESDGSLLNFDPDLLVITNIEADHLDYFRTFDKILELFKTFLGKIKPGGKAIAFGDHPHIQRLLPFATKQVISYGVSSTNDYYYTDYKQKSFGCTFKVNQGAKELGRLVLQVPGEHNALNALAALAVGLEEGLSFKQIKDSLKSFSGVKRRFQLLGKLKEASFFDDYAHHPTEVAATLKTAATEKNGRLICVFQPHRYSRTGYLADDFGASFADADMVVITDVYPAEENPIPGVSGKLVADAILSNEGSKNLAYLPYLADVVNFLEGEIMPGDMVITMGAGDISTVAQKLLA